MHNFVLETERLILRPLTVDDCDAVYRWVSDEDVTRYMVYNTYTSKEPLAQWLKSLDDDPDYHFGFVRKDTGELIGSGSIGPHNGDKERWGFGYNLLMSSRIKHQVMSWRSAVFTLSVTVSLKSLTGHAGCVRWNMKENLICKDRRNGIDEVQI